LSDGVVTKKRIFEIIWEKSDPNFAYAIKFEAIDRLRSFSLNKNDVSMVIDILEKHPDMMVRHEAAFVLLELEESNPRLLKEMSSIITSALSRSAKYDKSLVVRHETLEALGYVGDETCLNFLRLSTKSRNKDIQESALVALQLLEFRLNLAPISKILSENTRKRPHTSARAS